MYFIYGNHYCLNVSCLPDGIAGGVLFRALEPVAGTENGCGTWDSDSADDLKTLSWLRRISSGPGTLG